MNKVIIFSICFLLFLPSFSQNEIGFEEHRKYWYYKNRLHLNFVNVALQEDLGCNSTGGQSIPAGRYNLSYNSDGDELRHLYYDEDNLMWFGQYIGVLATEFKLLNDREEWSQAEDTKRELYYAMMAYERLDRKSL